MRDEPLREEDRAFLELRLEDGGDGVLRIERRCPAGHPLVVRTRPLRDSAVGPRPFPTHFWLVCPEVARRIARRERAGGVRDAERWLASGADRALQWAEDHRRHGDERWAALDEAEREIARARGFESVLRDSGIGGSRDLVHLKCLHLHAAFHLARGSCLGEWFEAEGLLSLCPAESGGESFPLARVLLGFSPPER